VSSISGKQVLLELTKTMMELVSTVEGLNSTVMTAMTAMAPSPAAIEEQPSADKIRILQTEIAKLTKTVHELKTLKEDSRPLEEEIEQFRHQVLGQEESENVLDLSSLIDDAFISATTASSTTTTTTTTTEVPITTFNWFTSTPSTRRPMKKKPDFVPSQEGEGFLEITVSGSMGPGGKKQPGNRKQYVCI
jgi:hypothetical protein